MQRNVARTALAGAAGLLLAGCASARAAHPPPSPSPSPTHPAATARPRTLPASTTYLAGQTVHINDAADGVVLALTASRPSTSTTRLSSTYGSGPAHGYYVTFQMTLANAGQASVPVQVTQFVVDVPGAKDVTVNEGNAPFSGEPRTLDNTVLLPGSSDTGALTYDVPAVHGVLRYVQSGRTICSWRF